MKGIRVALARVVDVVGAAPGRVRSAAQRIAGRLHPDPILEPHVFAELDSIAAPGWRGSSPMDEQVVVTAAVAGDIPAVRAAAWQRHPDRPRRVFSARSSTIRPPKRRTRHIRILVMGAATMADTPELPETLATYLKTAGPGAVEVRQAVEAPKAQQRDDGNQPFMAGRRPETPRRRPRQADAAVGLERQLAKEDLGQALGGCGRHEYCAALRAHIPLD